MGRLVQTLTNGIARCSATLAAPGSFWSTIRKSTPAARIEPGASRHSMAASRSAYEMLKRTPARPLEFTQFRRDFPKRSCRKLGFSERHEAYTLPAGFLFEIPYLEQDRFVTSSYQFPAQCTHRIDMPHGRRAE